MTPRSAVCTLLTLPLVLSSLAVLPSWAQAQAGAAEAEQLFRDGKRLMQEKKFAEACSAFETSHQIDPALTTKVNLADCREKNGQLATAWGLFVDAERETRGDATQAALNKLSKTRSQSLEGRLSYLTISVPAENQVEGLIVLRNGAPFAEGLWNRAVPVDGGETVIAGSAPGHEEWSTTINVPLEGGKSNVEVPKFKELEKLADEATTSSADGDLEERSPSGTLTGRRKIAIGVAGVGVVTLAVGAVLGVQARGLRDDARTLCPENPCDGFSDANMLVDRAESRALFANVSFSVGAAAVIGGAVLWFTGSSDERSARTSLRPHVSPTVAGLDISGRF